MRPNQARKHHSTRKASETNRPRTPGDAGECLSVFRGDAKGGIISQCFAGREGECLSVLRGDAKHRRRGALRKVREVRGHSSGGVGVALSDLGAARLCRADVSRRFTKT